MNVAENAITVGAQIRIMRTIRDLKQGEFARQIGISQQLLSYIETNKVAPTPSKMEAIKAALNWPQDADTAFAILATTDGQLP